ncbi:hypothetical protein SOVF_156380 [Spinacia oleracea]|nr:hypothetical protein SOVF_156380 [Spinacia oleracea]
MGIEFDDQSSCDYFKGLSQWTISPTKFYCEEKPSLPCPPASFLPPTFHCTQANCSGRSFVLLPAARKTLLRQSESPSKLTLSLSSFSSHEHLQALGFSPLKSRVLRISFSPQIPPILFSKIQSFSLYFPISLPISLQWRRLAPKSGTLIRTPLKAPTRSSEVRTTVSKSNSFWFPMFPID